MWHSDAEIVQAAHAEECRSVDVERLGVRAILRLVDADKVNVLSAPLMIQLLSMARSTAVENSSSSAWLSGSSRIRHQSAVASSTSQASGGAGPHARRSSAST